MSRIHEALKKAEQERMANQGGAPSGLAAVPATEVWTPENGAGSAGNGSSGGSVAMLEAAPLRVPTPEGLDALCTACEWNPDPATMLFLNGDNSASGTEEYRTLRSRLYSLREKMPLKKVLVTSALPREGKSFTAANLAQVMVRQHGRKALLIDADLRAPRLHEMLGTRQEPGLSDYLQGKCDEYAVMQRGPLENLYFIPCGTSTADPAEMVGNGRIKMLLQRVEAMFDWIIIDSPPAIPVSDASVLAKDCDGVLMVVRSDVTPADVARKAREEFPQEALLGVVLNGTHTPLAPYSRYYYEVYQNGKGGAKAKS